MNKLLKKILLLVLVLAGILSGYQSIQNSSVSMDALLAFCTGENGTSILSWYEDDKTVIAKVGQTGKIEKTFRFDTEKKDSMYNIKGIAASEDYVYVLRNKVDCYTGSLQAQELMVLDFNCWFVREKKTFDLTNEENYCYQWINVSGDTVSLIGTDAYESSVVRKIYEFGSVLEDTLSLKNMRVYPMKTEEGIYQAIGNSTDLVYISDSGKVYCADEQKVKEIYPARTLDTLLYPTYISYAESGYIYLGEHETGNIIKLDISTGEEETILSGSSPLGGSSLYTSRDVVAMSMSNLNNFTAVVKSSQTEHFQLLMAKDGSGSVITSLNYGVVSMAQKCFLIWLSYAFIIIVTFVLVWVFAISIRGGYTIMERLISATIPLLAITMTLFGVVSFQYYRDAIDENFEKQAMDEGNMLAALFGQESFNEIEYPYDYSGEAYTYLSQQIETRDLYTRVVYYEGGDLYIGVDKNYPCFYPFEILLNLEMEEDYIKSAQTGESIITKVKDQLGERLICITPIGGLSGETVYLLETGIFTANIDSYASAYIKDFVIVCVAFLIIVMVVLMILFHQILFPIGEIKRDMQRFADGDRSIRIKTNSEDELTGIAQVFNKMADDIDVQILSLERMSQTYYRFVPPSIISLLGKNNLGSLTLGSNVKGNLAILNIRLYPEETLPLDRTETLMNRFFNTVNQFTQQNDIISIVDDANLQSMMLICQNGVDAAIVTALTILARIDADNKLFGREEQLDVVFVLDQNEVYFGICGDDERYIPAVIAPEFERLLSHGQFLRSMGSHFLMTSAAYQSAVNMQSYANRYIGRLQDEEMNVGLYDIYDDKNAEQLRVMKQTQHVFDKAMELYEKGYYYEAKNMYAMVLRENQQDMVSKYYIFRCEALQKQEQ